MPSNQDPVIILVAPQLGENIGMCARAMLNCGLKRLRLVNPRDGWPQASARAAAADADIVIDSAEVFPSLPEAVADCSRVYATTARQRAQSTPVLEAEAAVGEMHTSVQAGETVAVLFGAEASGLDGESVSHADTLVRFPTNPEFSSLNLAQAVLLLGWEWLRVAGGQHSIEPFEPAAKREEFENYFARLIDLLDASGFFLTEEMKPHSVKTLRSIFSKTKATSRELQLL
ncbi:MAG: TrmH family RNA methyltransferase, partial [Verrucomicrobiota bacterium]